MGDKSTNSNVKIVFITTVPVTLDSFYRGQFGYWKQNGFEVIAISSPGKELENVRDREGIQTFPVEMIRGLSPARDVRSIRQIYRLLSDIQPQIVHASTPKAGLVGMIAAAMANVPVRIFTLRGLMSEMDSRLSFVLRFMERFTCKLAHAVTANSASVAEVAVRKGICKIGKLSVLGNGSSNGVDATGIFNPDRVGVADKLLITEKFHIPEGDVVIGFAGRIVRDKGVLELAEAWEELRKRNPNIHLMIVGKPESDEQSLKHVIDRWQRDGRVFFTGWVPKDEMPLYYSIMDILVLPTYREGFPNVILEASAMEVPVVATRVTGCVDAVVDGVTGMLVEARNSKALSEAIQMYIRDPGLRSRHGKAGRSRALNEFRPEMIWDAIREMYAELLLKNGIAIPSICQNVQNHKTPH